MAWRNAFSLDTLIGQLNASYPGWLFLGTKGDAAHQAVASDHNPNAQGVVTALDIGPGGGLDIHALADRLLAKRHPDLKYIISNRRIAGDWTGWKWAKYNGSDPHDTHIHISVGRGDDGQSTQPYDDRVNWNVTDKGEEPMANEGDIDNLWRVKLPNSHPPASYVKAWAGKPFKEVFYDLSNNVPEWYKAGSSDAQNKLNQIKAIVG